NTVACFKWVRDSQDIVIRPDLSIDLSRAGGKISEYDRNVINAASTLSKAMEGKALGLTFGDETLKPALKDALSRGLDEVYYLSDALQATADGAVTAKLLAAIIRKMPDVGVVFCAEGAEDTFARQIGPRLAACLGLPIVSSVCHFEINAGIVTAKRKLEDYYETVTVACPVVIAILPDAAEAPIPGLRAVMAAGKKPQHAVTLEDLGAEYLGLTRKTQLVLEQGYLMQRKHIKFTDGDDREKVDAFLRALTKEGVL
ncbi:MAG: hypothetical protein RR731_06560, partial [Oscillospiraceae bacterium]